MKSVLTSPDIPYNEGMARPIRDQGAVRLAAQPAAAGAGAGAHDPGLSRVQRRDEGDGAGAARQGDRHRLRLHDGLLPLAASARRAIASTWRSSAAATAPRKGADGCDAVDSPLSNCSNAPVESLDIDYDFFRIVGYELAPDSFGLGARRGGAGFIRRCEILKDDVQLAIYSDRFRLAPEGLLGGEPGQRGYCRIHRADGTVEELKSKAAVDLAKGDVVEMFVGGGGGFGRISERPDAMIDRDLADGLLTRDPRPARKLAAE